MFKIYTLLIMLLSLGGCTDGIRIKQNPTSSIPGPISFSSQSINEGDPINFNINDGIGDDTFLSSGTITYNCYYDTTIDNDVTTSSSCSSLSGLTFDTDTGSFTWSPGYLLAGSYEFKVMASNGTQQTEGIFAVTINNADAPPVIAPISNVTVDEGQPISINAADINSGGNTDADGDTITYSCYYDTTIDGTVASVSACTTLTGVSFNSATGAMDWTPDGTQAGSYEFKIIASEGDLSVDQIFAATISNADGAPILSTISDQSVNENNAITQINTNDTSGGDTDLDGDTITYSCYYDTTVDAAVASVTACTSLTGVSFNTTTGVMDWTPDYTQSGDYEFKIIGSEGDLTDDEIFSVTVNNTDRAPVLSTISDQTVSENSAITQINANDTAGGDADLDGDTITYSCYYDTTVDAAVASVTACTSLTGVSFNTTTGVMDWTPDGTQLGHYEFKIIGSEGNLADDEIFSIEVITTPEPFVSIWRTTGVGESITLPLRNGYNYNFQVDWGDGSPVSTITSYNDPDRIHPYAVAGTYTVTITGTAEAWYFNNGGSKLNIIEVVNLGNLGWLNLESAFAGCENLTSFAGGDTSQVTSMRNMFHDGMSLTTVDLSSFYTTNVTNMSGMFQSTSNLTTLDLSNFNTSSVTDMGTMFGGASSLTILDISSFDTAAVTNMSSMFSGINATLDLSNFNTAAVTNMSWMFSFNGATTLDLSNFNTSSVTDMSWMFAFTSNLTSLNADTWNISAVTISSDIWTSTNPGLIVECDQGGSPGTGTLFGKPCN